MPTVVKRWLMDSTVEGWAQVSPSLPTAALTWESADGSPSNGCLKATRDHDTGDGIQKYRSAAGETWESWGVPPTAEVLTCQLALKAKTADATTTQVLDARVVDGSFTSVTSADLIDAVTLPAPSAWTAINGALRSVDFLSQESTQSVRLELEINAIEAGIETSDFRFDTIELTITYDDGSTSGGSSMATPIDNLNGIVFMKGFLTASRSGAGFNDAVGMGALQECSINHSYEFAEAKGPESLQPLAVGVVGENLSGSIRHLVLNAEQLLVFLGGSASYSGGTGKTTFTKLTDEEPNAFDLRLKTPLDGSDLEVLIYNCLANSMPLVEGGANREFKVFGLDWRGYGQNTAQGKRLFQIITPGNQTSAS